MSHYKVAVFTENEDTDLDELLAPYDENRQVPRYVDFTKQQLIDSEKELIHKYNMIEREDWTDEQIYNNAVDEYNYTDIGPDGEIYSTYNPDSKWDWWSLGGRFAGELLLKERDPDDDGDDLLWTSMAKVRAVDFNGMREFNLANLKPYKEFMSEEHLFKKEYIESIYPDEETFILKGTTFYTYAVITPDGKWHSMGDMGWFGCSSETPDEETKWVAEYEEHFIKPALENDWYITIIDCHI